MEQVETVNWTEARCATGDARLLHLFFSEEQAEIAEAKATCASCPLRLPCLEGAIERREPWGVWGGHLFDRGEVILRKRRRGRPSNEDLRLEQAARLELEDLLEVGAVRQVEVA